VRPVTWLKLYLAVRAIEIENQPATGTRLPRFSQPLNSSA
jgi:hypothetical protein